MELERASALNNLFEDSDLTNRLNYQDIRGQLIDEPLTRLLSPRWESIFETDGNLQAQSLSISEGNNIHVGVGTQYTSTSSDNRQINYIFDEQGKQLSESGNVSMTFAPAARTIATSSSFSGNGAGK